MEKTIYIEGMSCGHCKARVEAALGALDGVGATVDLAAGTAVLTLTKPVSDEDIKEAVEELGFVVKG